MLKSSEVKSFIYFLFSVSLTDEIVSNHKKQTLKKVFFTFEVQYLCTPIMCVFVHSQWYHESFTKEMVVTPKRLLTLACHCFPYNCSLCLNCIVAQVVSSHLLHSVFGVSVF